MIEIGLYLSFFGRTNISYRSKTAGFPKSVTLTTQAHRRKHTQEEKVFTQKVNKKARK